MARKKVQAEQLKESASSSPPEPEVSVQKEAEAEPVKKEPKVYVLKPRPLPEPPKEGEDFIAYLKEVFAEVRLEQEQDEQLPALKQRFSVRDPETANWAAGKIAMWQNEVERRKVQAREYIEDAERTLRRLEYLFKDQLEAWARMNLPKDKKSLKLASATLMFRKTDEKLEIEDEDKVLNWATINCPDAIKIKRTVLLDPLKAHYKEHNIIPNGCRVIPEGENFHVKG